MQDLEKVNAIVEDANTPSDVRAFLQSATGALAYVDSVNVDEDGVVTPKEADTVAEVNDEYSTGQPTAPAEVPVAEGDTGATQTEAVPTAVDPPKDPNPPAGNAVPPTNAGESSTGPGVAGSSGAGNG